MRNAKLIDAMEKAIVEMTMNEAADELSDYLKMVDERIGHISDRLRSVGHNHNLHDDDDVKYIRESLRRLSNRNESVTGSSADLIANAKSDRSSIRDLQALLDEMN